VNPGMIELQAEKAKRTFYVPPKGHVTVPIRFAFPYFKAFAGIYTHRIRSGKTYIRNGVTSHAALQLWCGQCGFLEPESKRQKGQMFAELPEGSVLCATCEGRAIGSGMDGPTAINGRDVIFSPRK